MGFIIHASLGTRMGFSGIQQAGNNKNFTFLNPQKRKMIELQLSALLIQMHEKPENRHNLLIINPKDKNFLTCRR